MLLSFVLVTVWILIELTLLVCLLNFCCSASSLPTSSMISLPSFVMDLTLYSCPWWLTILPMSGRAGSSCANGMVNRELCRILSVSSLVVSTLLIRICRAPMMIWIL